ncbi:MAG: lytic transglycosylase domain-containing protein [Treponema sp.]|nr:lytic transglycosylase domain-containing protein [Candidatus Treponema equi]
MKKTPLALSAFSAVLLFAEPVADFTLASSEITVDCSSLADLDEIRRLEELRTQIEKNGGSPRKEMQPYTIPDPVRKDIGLSGLDHERTKKFLDFYLSDEGRKRLSKILMDSAEYRCYVREQLEKRKLPMFLQYLPIVESEYKTNAVSVSGATGMWQFMENSMEPFLKKNEWYDERLDPWIETDAALSKLSDNYKMFGDWELALAAYNMGAGAIKRIKKQSKADFWMLADLELLSEQAAMYVPKLIAITEVVENAEYYGFLDIGIADKTVETLKTEKFGKVKITGKISLEKIAEKSGCEIETLTHLNPALIKGCTPPKETWVLRVPAGTAKDIAASLR